MNGLGIPMEQHTVQMNTLSERQKVKVLLAKALFGSPSIILLDEPTNGLDIDSIEWLEEFLIDYDGTILVVSHDRHFLNAVCTQDVYKRQPQNIPLPCTASGAFYYTQIFSV